MDVSSYGGLVMFYSGFCMALVVAPVAGACLSKMRPIYTSLAGQIQIGNPLYSSNQSCEWLIRGMPGQHVTVFFSTFETEGGYDFLYVFDGESYSSPMIASLSGNHNGLQLVSKSHQMLLRFTSNELHERSGFNLEYTVSDCPMKCSSPAGNCVGGRCVCLAGRSGDACEWPWCPRLCSPALKQGVCNMNEADRCTCASGFYGEACSIPTGLNSAPDSWHNVSSHSGVFTPRAGHVSVFDASRRLLWLHGGFNLNQVFDNLLVLNLTTSDWKLVDVNGSKPVARAFHAAAVFRDAMIMYGGELADGNVSSELWSFNMTSMVWILLNEDSTLVPALAAHTLTIVENKAYVFGGRTTNDRLSGELYVYDLIEGRWQRVIAKYGLVTSYRLMGHSSVYVTKMQSLVVFGGFTAASEKSPSKLSKAFLSYSIEEGTWTKWEIEDQDTLSPALAYHSMVVAGDYLVIYGGVTTVNVDLEYSASPTLYFYNLKCQKWISARILSQLSPVTSKEFEPTRGRYLHSLAMVDEQTVLFIGGFNGIMLGDVLAYRLPGSVLWLDPDTGQAVEGRHCAVYSRDDCTADPACGWCFQPRACYSLLQSAFVCPAGLLLAGSCPGSCSHFGSCEACASGRSVTGRRCQWCVPGGRCDADERGCDPGSWESGYRLLNETAQCQLYDRPPGLMLISHVRPKLEGYPDDVRVISSGKVLLETIYVKGRVRERDVVLAGLIYPYVGFKSADDTGHMVRVHAQYALVEMDLSSSAFSSSREKVLALDAYTSDGRIDANRPYMRKLFPVPPSFTGNVALVWFSLNVSVSSRGPSPAFVDVQWNHTGQAGVQFDTIAGKYLQPFYSANCSVYPSCVACIGDASCGWCRVNRSCLPRALWQSCPRENGHQVYLVRRQSDCPSCDGYWDCVSCTQDPFCEWDLSSPQQCYRRNLLQGYPLVNRDPRLCAGSCYNTRDAVSCLNNIGCIWCSAKLECVPQSMYASRFVYGQCEGQIARLDFVTTKCDALTTCVDCFLSTGCGWCHDQFDPRVGRCTDGDFAGPIINCSKLMATNGSVGWAYSRCPDVDECKVNAHDCVGNATCLNTDGSYDCVCMDGFEGDGRLACQKTCWPACGHGRCEYSNFTCACDLGWFGDNCSLDCGCYEHSTCGSGLGKCDRCQRNTVGEFCNRCALGSYGNATTSAGCLPCECNGHGDEGVGVCDPVSGVCFCKDSTTGDHCEKCEEGYSGDARDGNACYIPCKRSAVLSGVRKGYIYPSSLDAASSNVFCSWVLSPLNMSSQQLVYGKYESGYRIRLSFEHVSIPCFNASLVVYDGVPPNPRTVAAASKSKFNKLGFLCGDRDDRVVMTALSGVISIVYAGPIAPAALNVAEFKGAGFIGKYEVFSCPTPCLPPLICDLDDGGNASCQCPHGHPGIDCRLQSCPNGCNFATSKGYCDKVRQECVCYPGYVGPDCSEYASKSKLVLQMLPGMTAAYQLSLARSASTMTYFAKRDSLIVYGGQPLQGDGDDDLIEYNIAAGVWTKLRLDALVKPARRSHHCMFLYEESLFVYGGQTEEGITDEFMVFDLNEMTWKWKLVHSPGNVKLPFLAAHTCTLVRSDVYVVGGSVRGEGLSENLIKINLLSNDWTYVKYDYDQSFAPTGVYGHIAFYDEQFRTIFVHGGMAFYGDGLHDSDRIYMYSVGLQRWTFLEKRPDSPAPSLYGHVGAFMNGRLYVLGGYSSALGFNHDLHVWKMSCNEWLRIQRNDSLWVGSGSSGLLHLAAAAVNGSLFMYGGFNLDERANMTWFAPGNADFCTRHASKDDCLSEHECSWCQPRLSQSYDAARENQVSSPPTSGYCFSTTVPSPCQAPVETANGTAWSVTWLNTTRPCSFVSDHVRSCGTYSSCVSCLARYIAESVTTCKWCRCPFQGSCVDAATSCPDGCLQMRDMSLCYEMECEASSCGNCGGTGVCVWTQHLLYGGESRRLYSKKPVFPWNCFRKKLESISSDIILYDKSPPNPCPRACSSITACADCLSALGDYGGTSSCRWSQTSQRCVSLALVPLVCSSGQCGLLLSRERMDSCPVACAGIAPCSVCLRSPGCGWCAEQGNLGRGTCMAGDMAGPLMGSCGNVNTDMELSVVVVTNSSLNETATVPLLWSYVLCPLEDECRSGHHTCSDREICVDLIDGFDCLCLDGYTKRNGKCVPICEAGCVQGVCVLPNVCQCDFGWTGSNCSVACLCNGHGICINETLRDVCTQCRNNTQGSRCDECQVLFVGDATKGPCVPCSHVCHGNTDTCLSRSDLERLSPTDAVNASLLRSRLAKGVARVEDVVCTGCGRNSEGIWCETCEDGFFLVNGQCTRCQCNGHSFACNKTTGLGCQCAQNTRANPLCKADCWKEQCNQCESSMFVGDPRDGHQCYKKILFSIADAVSLESDRSSFYVVSPGYTNVDMRLVVDVVSGEVDVFVAASDQVFVVDVNTSSGAHSLLVKPSSPVRRRSVRESGVPPTGSGEFLDVVGLVPPQVSSFADFRRHVLKVSGVRKRLTVMIPFAEHDLSKDWFYISLSTIGKSGPARAFVYFRQDLPRIDLLLFFLVLTVVLLFVVSSFVMGWKMRLDQQQRARAEIDAIRLEAMASRPLATYQILISRRESVSGIRKRKSRWKQRVEVGNGRNGDVDLANHNICVAPLTVQNTEDNCASVVTAFIQYPENKESLWNFGVGAGLSTANHQQLLQVRVNPHGPLGRQVNTRILNTVT